MRPVTMRPVALRPARIAATCSLLLMFACTGESPESPDSAPPTTPPTDESLRDDAVAYGAGGAMAVPGVVPTTDCGDGVLDVTEACDDGNLDGGDGCEADCLAVGTGFTCPTPGAPCRPFIRCGDGRVDFPEQCDDGASVDGDGCSVHCKVELGFKCDGAGVGACTPTACGDGVVEGAETCDDGNQRALDGCSSRCIAEPQCTGGPCRSACGDGIVLGEDEACDDGNLLAGDGCDADCQVEAGYACVLDEVCERAADGTCVQRMPVVYRDFGFEHPDFEASACGGSAATPGLVQQRLIGGRPAPTGTAMCTSGLSDWYADLPGTNVRLDAELRLYDDGAGNYVNRHGATGERWETKVGWGCDGGGPDCMFDGSPFFFPVDGIAGALDNGGVAAAVATEQYGMDGSLYSEAQATGSPAATAPKHNFAFTTEATYWFRYDSDRRASLDFIGDDDVWVFIDGQLVLDLGGLHPAVGGSFTLDRALGDSLGLEHDAVYPIQVFHAERKSNGSTFRLTLSGFSAGRSLCQAVCGDGLIGAGEQCDDGDNTGGYNACQPGCVLGARCGDGILQDGEDCDDGNMVDGDGCGSSCRDVVLY